MYRIQNPYNMYNYLQMCWLVLIHTRVFLYFRPTFLKKEYILSTSLYLQITTEIWFLCCIMFKLLNKMCCQPTQFLSYYNRSRGSADSPPRTAKLHNNSVMDMLLVTYKRLLNTNTQTNLKIPWGMIFGVSKMIYYT